MATKRDYYEVLGVDRSASKEELKKAYRRMARTTFLRLWPLKYAADKWTIVRIPLRPGHLRTGKTADTFTAADFAQRTISLRDGAIVAG